MVLPANAHIFEYDPLVPIINKHALTLGSNLSVGENVIIIKK